MQVSRTLAKYYGEVDFPFDKVKMLLENEDNIQALNWLKRQIEKIIDLKMRSSKYSNDLSKN